ncbi:hypothetical protein SAMN05421810_103265 [Amycolatopsis arida]|uniref:Uncharacterized protein n=1 Tax=Amycolatopsis arida TaxID=587909 RepID=A0A1I5STC3_9PSEU|nr:hypothetical protein [Amycolatopsis arida]TDX96356.1 hypothetical protein CLV69_103493 [Amycolatopsis arida]SFP74022.1 hypothetical protein SAMN05421810_103265 [Amycolatopsis arida]
MAPRPLAGRRVAVAVLLSFAAVGSVACGSGPPAAAPQTTAVPPPPAPTTTTSSSPPPTTPTEPPVNVEILHTDGDRAVVRISLANR